MIFNISLNPAQEAAVRTTEGPLLVIAGAGSGKTRVLTERISYLVREKNVSTNNILAVTFTNKAASEMKARLLSEMSYPWIGTFHSICNKILNIETQEPFIIYDTKDQQDIIKGIIKKKDWDISASSVLYSISNAKNQLITPENYYETAYSGHQKYVAEIYFHYQKALLQNGALDFDDLLNHTINLFQTNKEVLSKYQNKFQYILIDEYQDTNHAQYILSKLLASKYKNICVVGDVDQNIYSWRGASISNILNFEKDFPAAKTIKLEQNYRSTKKILQIANQVINKNSQRMPKQLWTDNESGDKGELYIFNDEKEESNFLADEILNHDKRNEIVILYRTNAQSRIIEDVLVKRAIPYKIVGGIKFYSRKEIKDILAYVRYLYNESDQVAFLRISKLPALKKFLAIKDSIGGLITPIKIINKILEVTNYKNKLEKKNRPEDLSRIENIDELISVASTYNTLEDFLSYTALVTDLDTLEDTTNTVTLMTLHAVKGLEFPFVYIVGCEEGLLPHYKCLFNNTEIEEERRLFYVGITRAKKKVKFTIAKKRLIFGKTCYYEPSRFIQDIPEELLIHNNYTQEILLTYNNLSHDTHDNKLTANYLPGQKVSHNNFGVGEVKSVNGDDLIIIFNEKEKLLSAKYAKLEKL